MEKALPLPKDRHCAFCLISIPCHLVKCCSKCHRRAYCSKSCQVDDWKPKYSSTGKSCSGNGQGHKSWCGLPSGEEDLDWIVSPIKGKGLGLIAIRLIPDKTRILVDGFRSDLNLTSSSNLANNTAAAAALRRGSLANHSCSANASRAPDPDYKAMILYTKSKILPGTEICLNYTKFNEDYDPVVNIYEEGKFLNSFADARQILKSHWKISCPQNCFCRNTEMEKLIQGGKTIAAYLKQYCNSDFSPGDGDVYLAAVGRMLDEHHGQIQGSWTQRAELLEIGFQLAVQRKGTLALAQKFINEAYEIWTAILHPKGSVVRKAEGLMRDIGSAEKYLRLMAVS